MKTISNTFSIPKPALIFSPTYLGFQRILWILTPLVCPALFTTVIVVDGLADYIVRAVINYLKLFIIMHISTVMYINNYFTIYSINH